ncbi:MAG: YhcN/YlaJ family sporulation lipoprotein [Clostridia bacterium]|nr:YhcN/YlaJ family sporulation lipoprotein [Clostridia bacterium]
MKKIGCFVCSLMMAALLFTGCSRSSANDAAPTPDVTQSMPQNSPATSTTDMPILSDLKEGANNVVEGAENLMGLTSLQDVQQASEEMEDAVEQLSEVDDAYVIAHGNKALVGLEMNSQYQGGVDERLQKMVLARLQTIEKGISQAAITDDAQKVQSIRSLTEKLDDATDLSQILPMMEEIMQGMDTYNE